MEVSHSSGRRRLGLIGGVFVLVGALAVLAVATTTTAAPRKANASKRVAFLLPENVTPRWEGFDHPTFVRALKKLVPGVAIDVMNARNSPTTQQSQAEQEITKGVKVLVVAPIDGKGFGAVAARAIAQGVKVVAYDRLISNAKTSAYISFDGVAVGKAQGNKGYLSILTPLFNSGARKVVGPKAGTWTPGWDPPTAQREMEQLLTKSHNGIDAVLSANDGMAGGIIAALKAQGKAGKVPVTGQDASLEGLQNIIRGYQGMSVFKDFRLQAPAAAKITAALLSGKSLPGINKHVQNGAGSIPAVILPVHSIDKTNLSTLVKNGYINTYLGGLKKVCKGMPKRYICK